MALELPFRLELPWFEHGDEIIQLGQVILHRRSGEHQHILLLQGVDEPPGDGGTVLQMMSLVYDHHVVGDSLDDLAVAHQPCRSQRGNHPVEVLPGFVSQGLKASIVVGNELQKELAGHLLPPLLNEARRGED